MGSTEGIRGLAEPALASVGLELWDVEVSPTVVRILVDRPGGGIDLDALTRASGVLSPLLDQRPDLTPDGRFQLEVSSPGVERTLRSVEQFGRYVGSEVTVKTNVVIEGSRRHQGTLVYANETCIGLRPDDAPQTSILEIPYEHIERGRTVLVWGPKAAPAHKRGSSAPRTAALEAKDTRP